MADCTAVGMGREELLPGPSPPIACVVRRRERDGGLALWPTDGPGGHEQPIAKTAQGRGLQPPELALEEHHQIVGRHRQRGLACP